MTKPEVGMADTDTDTSTDTSTGAGAGRGDGHRVPLSREDVLVAALALIDADGVEALSMRRLGKALGRDPMRVYRHAASKEALLDGVVDLVLSQLTVPALQHAEDGERVLRVTAHAFRALALAHPHVVPLLVTRPLATPLALRPSSTLRSLEALLELFIVAGLDGRSALHACRLYIGFLCGHVLEELQERVRDRDESDDALRLGLHHLPIREFPRLRALGNPLAGYDGERELDEGLDVILAGLPLRTRPSTSITTGSSTRSEL